jgi:hypothetical protein
MHPSNSQQVPQVLNVFPNLISSLVSYISNAKEEITTYMFWDCPKLEFIFLVMGQSKMPITKEKYNWGFYN